jgi:hypothetical protein
MKLCRSSVVLGFKKLAPRFDAEFQHAPTYLHMSNVTN